MSEFEDFIGAHIGQQITDIEAIKRALVGHATVSCSDKEIRIVFDDHDAKDLVMDFLAGTQPEGA